MIEMLSMYGNYFCIFEKESESAAGKCIGGKRGRVKIMYNFDGVYQYTTH